MQAATEHNLYVALGTNLGDKERNIDRAYTYLAERVGRIERRSSLFHSSPWGFQSDNEFINSVCLIVTTLSPHAVLNATQQIERDMGRTTKSVDGVYHDRIIDIDLLMYDDITLQDECLRLPHPLMQERDFVMTPLREIAGDDAHCTYPDDNGKRTTM